MYRSEAQKFVLQHFFLKVMREFCTEKHKFRGEMTLVYEYLNSISIWIFELMGKYFIINSIIMSRIFINYRQK